MGNLPAKVTGRYQSYNINTPDHMTPPMTLRRHNASSENSPISNNFHHLHQQQYNSGKESRVESQSPTFRNSNQLPEAAFIREHDKYVHDEVEPHYESDLHESHDLDKSNDSVNGSFSEENDKIEELKPKNANIEVEADDEPNDFLDDMPNPVRLPNRQDEKVVNIY